MYKIVSLFLIFLLTFQSACASQANIDEVSSVEQNQDDKLTDSIAPLSWLIVVILFLIPVQVWRLAQKAPKVISFLKDWLHDRGIARVDVDTNDEELRVMIEHMRAINSELDGCTHLEEISEDLIIPGRGFINIPSGDVIPDRKVGCYGTNKDAICESIMLNGRKLQRAKCTCGWDRIWRCVPQKKTFEQRREELGI